MFGNLLSVTGMCRTIVSIYFLSFVIACVGTGSASLCVRFHFPSINDSFKSSFEFLLFPNFDLTFLAGLYFFRSFLILGISVTFCAFCALTSSFFKINMGTSDTLVSSVKQPFLLFSLCLSLMMKVV